jgi:hypothetical protein
MKDVEDGIWRISLETTYRRFDSNFNDGENNQSIHLVAIYIWTRFFICKYVLYIYLVIS